MYGHSYIVAFHLKIADFREVSLLHLVSRLLGYRGQLRERQYDYVRWSVRVHRGWILLRQSIVQGGPV